VTGSKDLFIFEIHKSTIDFFNNCLVGSHILAMSKRIMNEVMCLSEDLGGRMYYQDTDSFFIHTDDLKMLETEFKKTYNRELVGKDLGQFHSDFSSRDGRSDVKYALECLFIRKKNYIVVSF
jgi:DNA polymerase elongation subunit (family B)